MSARGRSRSPRPLGGAAGARSRSASSNSSRTDSPTPPPTQRKRKAASPALESPAPSASTKRVRITGPVAVNNVADAMSQVASTFGTAATEIATPTRRARAVKTLTADKTLSPAVRLKALRLFTKDIAVCDSYLAIEDRDVRNDFLVDVLESF